MHMETVETVPRDLRTADHRAKARCE